MKDAINHIRLENIAWIRFAKHVTSFGWKDLQNDVHFSISHRPQDDFVNLHITRNVDGTERNNNPKIEIARISKTDANEALSIFAKLLSHSTWEPLSLNLSKRKHKRSPKHLYLPFTYIEKGKQFFRIRRGIESILQKASTQKGGKKLTIAQTIAADLEKWVSNPSMGNFLLKQLKKLPLKPSEKFQTGLLLSKEYTGCIRFNKHGIYKLKDNPLLTVLERLFGPNLLVTLTQHIQSSINTISKSISYQQTKQYNNPIHLGLNQPSK